MRTIVKTLIRLMKGARGPKAGAKYKKRVPTGNPKRPWKYYYSWEAYHKDHGHLKKHERKQAGHEHPPEKETPARITPENQKARLRKAQTLRQKADTLQKQIDNLLNPAISHQNATARRAGIAANMSERGQFLQKIQTAMRAIADNIERSTLATELENINAANDVKAVLFGYTHATDPKYPITFNGAFVRKPHPFDEKKFFNRAKPMVANDGTVRDFGVDRLLKHKLITKQEHTLFKEVHNALKSGENFISKSEHGYTTDDYEFVKKYHKYSDITRLLSWNVGTDRKGNYYKKIKNPQGDRARGAELLRMGVKTNDQLLRTGAELQKLLDKNYEKPDPRAQELREAERKLIGSKIPGFFPTPNQIVTDMIDRADIAPGMDVLEPSAGKGDIADQLKDTGANLHAIEQSHTLKEILELKQHDVVADDFLSYNDQEYDRIVMNPPFEKGQDIAHVRHAFELLKPGGKLVAIMSESPFFRTDQKSENFRDFLEQSGGVSEKLPSGSFTGSVAFRQTGVNTRIVEMTKPQNSDYAETKRENRADNLRYRAKQKRQEAEEHDSKSRKISGMIPFGQPIMVGHHSEGRHRNAIKRIHRLTDKTFEAHNEADDLERRAQAAENNHAIYADDPEAVRKLRTKITGLEREKIKGKQLQKLARDFNANKISTEALQAAVEKHGLHSHDEAARHNQKYYGEYKVPGYIQTNLSGNIRTARQRLEKLEKQKAQPNTDTTDQETGIRVEHNSQDNRVRMHFPGKPPESVRKELKQNGFRWAPSIEAWQGYLSASHRVPHILEEARRSLQKSNRKLSSFLRLILKARGPKAGAKYYKRVPSGNPKRPWKYYYTEASYEKAHAHVPEGKHHGNEKTSEKANSETQNPKNSTTERKTKSPPSPSPKKQKAPTTQSNLDYVPHGQIKELKQYTKKGDYDRDTIEGIKESIRTGGFNPAFPLQVDRDEKGNFNIVSGHHRFTAVNDMIHSGELPKDFKVPVIVKKYDSNADRLMAQVAENVRRQVKPTDEATAFGKLVEAGLTPKEIAKKVGRSASIIQKRVALNNLTPNIFLLVEKRDRSLTLGVAEALGMHGLKDDGSINESIQLEAFRFFRENRARGYGPAEMISYISELKSEKSNKFFVNESRSETEREALSIVGSEEKASRNTKLLDGFIGSVTDSFQRLLGDSISQINPSTYREIAASIAAAKGQSSFSTKMERLGVLIKDLEIVKRSLEDNFNKISANAATPSMFTMAKSKWRAERLDRELRLLLKTAPMLYLVAKGGAHKYRKRIQTGNPKKPYRYIYDNPPRAPFQLKQEEKTATQGNLFGREESTRDNYRPKYKLKEDDHSIEKLVTSIKDLLARKSMDRRAQKFVERAYQAKTREDVLEIAKDYVNLSGELSVQKPVPAQQEMFG